MMDKLVEIGERESGPLGQAASMSQQIEAIDPSPGLHYVHVLLPHSPWIMSRTGVLSTYDSALHPLDSLEAGSPGAEFRTRLQYQLHSMQTGAVDALVGAVGRSSPVVADLGRHDARRHRRPRAQPHTS